MPKEFGGNNTFNVINLTPRGAGVEEPNLRANSFQEGEDNAYTERKNPTLQGPVTRRRLRRIQEEVQYQLTTLKDPRKGHRGSIEVESNRVNIDRNPTYKDKDNLRDIGDPMTRSKIKMLKQSLLGVSSRIKENLEQNELEAVPKWVTLLQVDEE
ncbi:hypothetical protein CR513_34728, partial [Mucuna pruriens]